MQASRAQAHSQQQALADLSKQHQEVCARLAAAATNEADLQLQLTRLSADKQGLQQQVDKVGRVAHSRVHLGPLKEACLERCVEHVARLALRCIGSCSCIALSGGVYVRHITSGTGFAVHPPVVHGCRANYSDVC
jgi:hypothetical protein